MNAKSAVFRVLNYANRNSIETESRVHALLYIVNEELEMGLNFEKNNESIDVRLYSQDVDEAISDLEKHRFIEIKSKNTIGGDTRFQYNMTEKGMEKAESLIQGSEKDQIIQRICNQYGEYPISNLLSDIQNAEPAHEWM